MTDIHHSVDEHLPQAPVSKEAQWVGPVGGGRSIHHWVVSLEDSMDPSPSLSTF